MKRIATLGASAVLGLATALGGAHMTQAVTVQSSDSCHFSQGHSFTVYNDTQEDKVEQTGATCTGPIN